MSSRNESEHEDDLAVARRFVDEELISDNDVEAWMEATRPYKREREKFIEMFRRVKENDPTLTKLRTFECDNCGLDSFEIETNAFPKKLEILTLQDNGFGVDGLRSLMPLLQSSSYLISLDVSGNNITPEGFSLLFWVFRDSPMEELICGCCGLDSIAIDDAFIPTNLKFLYLDGKYGGRIENSIKADGCREVAKLLLGESATLEILGLESNEIDDEGVAILVSALQNNTKVWDLRLGENEGITMVGLKLLLKLVNDASSIKSTLQSNHTLRRLGLSK